MITIKDKSEIVPLIRDVCFALTEHARDNEVALMLGTAAAESSLIHRKQIGGGPARGLFQMEPNTAQDIFDHYLRFHLPTFGATISDWLDISGGFFVPDREPLGRHLELNDRFAAWMARIHYLRDPDPIPGTLEGQAAYWKKIYNTPAGAGTVQHYLDQWRVLRCEELLEVT